VIDMKNTTLTMNEIEDIINNEWDTCKEILAEMASEKEKTLDSVMKEYQIKRPTLDEIIENCTILSEDELTWAQEEGFQRAISALIAAKILGRVQ